MFRDVRNCLFASLWCVCRPTALFCQSEGPTRPFVSRVTWQGSHGLSARVCVWDEQDGRGGLVYRARFTAVTYLAVLIGHMGFATCLGYVFVTCSG